MKPLPDHKLVNVPWEPLRRFLAGRRLTQKEIPFPQSILEEHELAGYIQHTQGLTSSPHHMCKRCGNKDPSLFGRFNSPLKQEHIYYCRHCLALGKISSTTRLYTWKAPTPTYVIPSKPLQWTGTLSTGQSNASNQVIKAIQENSSILVWAVCGAGKTEVLFHGIESALLAGKRVLLATPRTDVVKELAPRFKKAFPEVKQAALYGGHTKEDTSAPLILATTHQVMRFYQAFDVVIVDEVDAFPYTFDPSLKYGVLQAKKTDACEVYLSATPSKELRNEANLRVVRIPRRYHGYDLPVPRMVWCGNWKKALQKERVPKVVMQWIIEHVNQRTPALLFVPSIYVLDQVSAVLTTHQIRHAAVHSASEDRHTHIESFRAARLPLLITTTILERGITIPRVDIAILGAEADLFTESALVQISGRVGRDHLAPTGDAVFFHYGKTLAMRAAINHIRKMNEEEVQA